MNAIENPENRIVQERRHLEARNKTARVRCGGFEFVAYLDVDGRWKNWFTDEELKGVVEEIKLF